MTSKELFRNKTHAKIQEDKFRNMKNFSNVLDKERISDGKYDGKSWINETKIYDKDNQKK